ncbi:phosphate ABC transporter substrate-binding protein PstS [Amycolatopsis cynarae]|uniref:Phosphate ABC transporter substrate-binding protein PstS n=1 Tax=Amycolatopsis cynarae TaxID=2995223 RepID=A0ABY7B8T6_9PSEU|nr:phosphate ABC transporter substrate-binding protein PstS [Amycolatopsis sp. HUAS 11-8]WAL68354.1 phosphate ABC transporter substrate-binding protein PstS [Amycolatopsis sp. HUAS 11-8]
MTPRVIRRLAALAAVLALLLAGQGPALADSYVPISGAGSTWSSNALDQWRKNVLQYGMRISFAATGSTDGRNQFKAGQADFAVSEIPYGLTDAGVKDYEPNRGYAYMPIVAGGTSFMYNLHVGTTRVTNLRLSGAALAGIFTGTITNWADPAIRADNPGLALPARKIIPVVRSDGSGTSAQLTTYFAGEFGGQWDDFCRRAGRATPCGFTSNYPLVSPMVGQSGSLGVTNYVRQAQSEGAITYVEYSYARNAGFPIAKVLNKAGYYIEPKAPSVAVGLLGAAIKPDLTQELSGVYHNTDPRAYPLSSYSYMVLPTTTASPFTVEKGRTLSDFAYYFLCEGQQQADALGYSPLPINLVRAGLDQVARIPGSTKMATDLAKCNNPTFSPDGTNLLAKTAPYPSACDRAGVTQCAEGTGGAPAATPVTAGGQAGAAATANGPAASGPAAGPDAAGVPGQAQADPDTGQTGSTRDGGGTSALAVPVSLGVRDGDTAALLAALAVTLLLALLIGPPVLARGLRNRGGKR